MFVDFSKPLLNANIRDITGAWNKIAVKSKPFAEELVSYGLRGNVNLKFIQKTGVIDYPAFQINSGELTKRAKINIWDFLNIANCKKAPEHVTLKDYINIVSHRANRENAIRDPFLDYTI